MSAEFAETTVSIRRWYICFLFSTFVPPTLFCQEAAVEDGPSNLGGVTKGATGTTAVGSNFSDTLTLSQSLLPYTLGRT